MANLSPWIKNGKLCNLWKKHYATLTQPERDKVVELDGSICTTLYNDNNPYNDLSAKVSAVQSYYSKWGEVTTTCSTLACLETASHMNFLGELRIFTTNTKKMCHGNTEFTGGPVLNNNAPYPLAVIDAAVQLCKESAVELVPTGDLGFADDCGAVPNAGLVDNIWTWSNLCDHIYTA